MVVAGLLAGERVTTTELVNLSIPAQRQVDRTHRNLERRQATMKRIKGLRIETMGGRVPKYSVLYAVSAYGTDIVLV